MARRCCLLTLFTFASAGALALAEAPATPEPGATSKKADNAFKKARKLQFEGTPSPEFENVRQALNALTPAQRKRFEENFVRWSNLAPEEKKALGDREQLRRKIMDREVDAAIKETGLQLEGERREEFVKRYTEERRKIEEQLRKETNEKRKPLVHDLVSRLQSEFAAGAVVAPAAPPAP